MDDYEKDFPNFDWRETPYSQHPKKCICPKHEYFNGLEKQRSSPIVLKFCTDHLKIYNETFVESINKMNWFNKLRVKIAFKLKLIMIKELSLFQSDVCIWCRFGTGGRGIKVAPIP